MQDGDEANLNVRLEALSDGVIAITITLLVLDLHIPPAESVADAGALLDALADEWPAFLAYVTSFVVILIMWVNHRNVLRILDGPDVPFHLLNGLLLLMITVVPFSTALFAEHLGHGGERTAGAVYAGTWVIIALVFQAWWHYAARHRRLIAKHVPDEHLRAITRAYRVAPPAYGLAFALAFVSVPASFALIALLAAFYAITASTSRGRRVRPHAGV
ncbi:MAG TPA: TMEM175 family protein [Candidatus Thermoplasmatota archaeon]|nr:TMEM175 family protein [Candidatus Thermoplasmatota archaeon]